jgi:CRISPR type I-E-associated protein CasA/Cse1
MNLIDSPWIPVQLPCGSLRSISLKDLPASGAVRIAHPRSDLSLLTLELLVDLFQTILDPQSDDETMELACGKLPGETVFERFRGALEMDGEGPRFLQMRSQGQKPVPAGYLLFEAPAANTQKLNKDLYVSRTRYQHICAGCAPALLYLNTAHARINGSIYSPSRRSNSALAAIFEKPTVWETITSNILPAAFFTAPTRINRLVEYSY